MSNPNYTEVFNTVVSKSTVYNPNLDNERGFPYVTHSSTAVMTPAEWQAALAGRLIVTTTSGTGSNLQVGADTNANAKNLQTVIGIDRLNDNALLRILPSRSPPATGINILNTSGTATNVTFTSWGETTGAFTIMTTSTVSYTGHAVGGEAIILATNTNDTSGSETVQFTVLQNAGSSQ